MLGGLRPASLVLYHLRMRTTEIGPVLARLLSELVDGAAIGAEAYMLNPGDAGLLRSLDKLSAAEASRSSDGGATIAAHAEHVRYGLTLMNQWAAEGGNPFADAKWGDAWKTSVVSAAAWDEIRRGLREETHRWADALRSPRDVANGEISGMIGSIAHLAYHLGAIRQIEKNARGPKDGSTAP